MAGVVNEKKKKTQKSQAGAFNSSQFPIGRVESFMGSLSRRWYATDSHGEEKRMARNEQTRQRERERGFEKKDEKEEEGGTVNKRVTEIGRAAGL